MTYEEYDKIFTYYMDKWGIVDIQSQTELYFLIRTNSFRSIIISLMSLFDDKEKLYIKFRYSFIKSVYLFRWYESEDLWVNTLREFENEYEYGVYQYGSSSREEDAIHKLMLIIINNRKYFDFRYKLK